VNRVWTGFPKPVGDIPAWLESATSNGTHYRELWLKTVDEQLSLLKTAKAGLSKGALAVDQEVLNALGCFDKRVNGSGTVAAAAATFLASRFAADPLNGLYEAAYSRGADTDTLASLVGGLLGVVNGIEWLGSLADEVQDSAYLRVLARDLGEKKAAGKLGRTRITEVGLTRFLHGLPNLVDGQSITLADGQEARVHHMTRHPLASGKTERVVALCTTASGQTLYLKSGRR
jgi:hypothetical protein